MLFSWRRGKVWLCSLLPLQLILTVLLDTYERLLNPAPAPAADSNGDESEIDLGWKPEGHQKRKKGKQKAQDDTDLQLLEDESKVRRAVSLFFSGLRQFFPETPETADSGALCPDGARPTVTVR